MALVEVKNLKKYFYGPKGAVHAVDDVTMNIDAGETMGVVGESGCGKSTFGKTIMMLNKPTDGQVLFNYGGEFKDITKFTPQELFQFRKKGQMVFQDPYSALNPMKKIYTAFEEPLKVHGVSSREEREKIMQDVLKMVNIQPDYLLRYPREFSGGQRQRVAIARAVIMEPELLIADEPIASLDVSIQAQILNLIRELQNELGLTSLFVGHGLGAVRYVSDRIAVMYLGKIVEMPERYLCIRYIRIQKH